MAMAGQTVHFDADFTNNSLTPAVGSFGSINGALGLQTQQAWNTAPGTTYFGVSKATAFDDPQGFGTAKPFFMNLANTPVLGTTNSVSNVWVVDYKMISDVAAKAGNSGFLSSAPGVSVEANPFASATGLVAGVIANVEQSIFSSAYPEGGDPNLGGGTIEPHAIASTLTDAALPGQLNNEIHVKMAYQPLSGGFTRESTAALDPLSGAVVGTVGFNSQAAGTFRSDYTSGLAAQLYNNHGDGQVTYSAGAGGGADQAYNSARTDLELGLTHFTFKQVSASDFNTSGGVGLNDAGILVSNWLGTGKSFFQGDANGNGTVDINDAGILTSQWTASDDNIGTGTAHAVYNPANGHVSFEANGIAIWHLDSPTGLFTGSPTDLNPGPAVRWTISGTSQQATSTQIGEFIGTDSIVFASHFDGNDWVYDHVPGDLGALLPTNLTTAAGVTLTYNTLGGNQVTIPVDGFLPVPEPSTLVLAGLAGIALVGFARRRKAA